MKFVTIRDLRSKSRQVQDDLPKFGEMVLTSNGKPIAIMTAISEDSLEETLAAVRRARAVIAVTRLQLNSARSGKCMMPRHEIDDEIRQVRQRRIGR